MGRKHNQRRSPATNWDPVADWYAGWVGADGSNYHRELAIPAVLDLLDLTPGQHLLDIGAGAGVLASYVANVGAYYTGVDASQRLLRIARQRHGADGRFLYADATRLASVPELRAASFDAAVLMLSIQDMDPLDAVLASAAWALRAGGRLVLLLTHPCFRVPRQSGWGWDAGRRLRYRRVDRYLTPLAVPMKRYGVAEQQATRSFHRPLEAYINGLACHHLLIDQFRELATYQTASPGPMARAETLANREIPLFLAVRARKAG